MKMNKFAAIAASFAVLAGSSSCSSSVGQVNTDNKQMLAFKSGASLMAYQANVPVLPVYLVKNEKKLSRRVVLVGDPVYVRAESGERPSIKDLNRISDVLRQRELELVEKYNQKYGKEKKHD